jgi:CDP-6-deoxy-D-xylo-4-hexulose-3-dehydrase
LDIAIKALGIGLGDEVILPTFTIISPAQSIVTAGATPVLVDSDEKTWNMDVTLIESKITSKTKAILVVHIYGLPVDMDPILDLCTRYNLFLIEDAAEMIGQNYKGRPCGSFGDISTLSFYPNKHITTGEGGAVLAKKISMKPILESFRDWGRDCWCAPGCDNTCLKRYQWQLGGLPEGFDHKYIYSHIGYNLKSGDIQAAIGSVQLDRLPSFVSKRKSNWKYLKDSLSGLEEFLLLPEATVDSDPSWFGFAITLRESCPGSREDLLKFLNERQIGTRLLFAGNLLKQPAFLETPRRIVGSLDNTDVILTNTFWIGVWPGLTEPMLNYIIESFYDYFRSPQ